MNYNSRLLEDAVEQFSSLPGIGKKTALRLALHLLKQPKENVEHFGRSFIELRNNVRYCSLCNMISDGDFCPLCSDKRRDHTLLCVVESIRDVMSIEATEEYRGVYFVLGGIISPMDGVGPDDLPISYLKERISKEGIKEVVMALSTSMEGETTTFYISRLLSDTGVKITSIARGVGFGDDLEYTDQLTLGKSIVNRQPLIF